VKDIKLWYGHVMIEPNTPVVAGSHGTWRLTYIAGRYGIDNSGAIIMPEMLSFAIAILLRYMTGYEEGKGVDTRGNEVEGMLGVDEKGETYYIDDPRADRISRRLRMNLSRDESEPILDEILADEGMFRRNLLEMPELASTIKGYYHRIKERGLESTIKEKIFPCLSS